MCKRPTITCVVMLFLLIGVLRPLPASAAIPPARDVPFPGTLTLHVDATDLPHGLFTVQETIPVKPGPLTLFYPQWIPGDHSPTGAIEALAGLIVHVHGTDRRLSWNRDPLDVYAFHLDIPREVRSIDLDFQFTPESRAGNSTLTPELLVLQWHRVLLYPAGYFVRRIPIIASVDTPSGWQIATALEVENHDHATTRFAPTTVETLVDSPLYAGVHSQRVELDSGPHPVHLDLFADLPQELNFTPSQLEAHRRLVREALALFGARHYDHYDFLLAISQNIPKGGLEHHQSSNDSVRRGYFTDWDHTGSGRFLLAHEMVHSWNGKFRRPADLWTPNYNTPMQDSLLWVYEGLTEYYGWVLAARSGLWTQDLARAALAEHAANFTERRPGRAWRTLDDTTNQPIITPRRALAYISWQRSEDYYQEAAFLWLSVDTRLREMTGGKRSLDDFARAFFGGEDRGEVTRTYTFEDIVSSLNRIAPFDWGPYLKTRLDSTGLDTPDESLGRAGWQLVFKDQPSEFTKSLEKLNDSIELAYSIGLTSGTDGWIYDTVWQGPAFQAGLARAMSIVGVNGRPFTKDLLEQALKGADGKKVDLLVKWLDVFRTVQVEDPHGLRYPALAPVDGKADVLSQILKPRTPDPALP